jgi:glucuronate isomerase
MSFIKESFMIQNKTGQKLYDDYAKDMPVYDYHCHVNPKEIAEDKTYNNITEIWLGGDHYKWRAMRSNGVSEDYITGNAPDKEKFFKWAETMEYLIGNPLYHWTHLELKRFFDIDKVLSLETAEEIWNECNERLKTPDYSCRGLIKKSNVTHICTTDDPCDSLEYHKIITEDSTFDVKVLPTFRPDKAFNIHLETFHDYIVKLSDTTVSLSCSGFIKAKTRLYVS